MSMEFSRQEYWSGLLFPSLGDFPNPRTEPGSPALQADYLQSEVPGKTRKEEKSFPVASRIETLKPRRERL